MYHALKVTGIWTTDHILCLLGPICISALIIVERFHVLFNGVDHGDCALSWEAVMVIEAMLDVLVMYILLLIMDGEDLFCIII